MGERLICIQGVVGSSPISSTIPLRTGRPKALRVQGRVAQLVRAHP